MVHSRPEAGLAALLLLSLTSPTWGQDPTPVDAGVTVVEQAAGPSPQSVLTRTRSSSLEQRRAILVELGVPVPDAKGLFQVPKERQTEAQKKSDDERDWLEELKAVKDSPAKQDVVTDINALRELTTSQDPGAAMVILQFAFSPDGMIYRDECGRLLRKMSPYSLPALIRGSQGDKNADLRRYANYQLERMDRQSPFKALRDAPNDLYKIETMKAFAETQFREAVYAVMGELDNDNPQLRVAAREAWMKYIATNPHPVPKRKLVLAGGKQSEEEVPLWYNHRELMNEALSRKLQEVRGVRPKAGTTLEAMSADLFAYYDDKRAKALDARLDLALGHAKDGKLEAAVAEFDRILARDPGYGRRAEMAAHYLAYGDQLAEAKKWREASAAYGKAHSVGAPDVAQTALGKHYYARGREREKQGEDATTEFARAREVDPGQHAHGSESSWMLYVGLCGAFAGLGLLIVGVRKRRAREF